MKAHYKVLAFAGAAVWALAAPVVADTSVDEKVKCSATGTISISNVSGEIHVEAWDRSEVHVTGTLDEKVKDLRVRMDDGDVEIEVVLPRRMRGRGGEAKLTIRVPKGAELEVETVSASIQVEDVEGELSLESVSGSIDVQADAASADLATVSGAIDVRGKLRSVDAESVSGSIDLRETSGDADVSTTSGRINIHGGDFDDVSCASVSGSIRFEGRPVDDGEFEFENFSGSITLNLPSDVSAEIEVETFSGKIESEFGGKVYREEYGPGASLEETIGDGAAEFRVSTFSGSVHLNKK